MQRRNWKDNKMWLSYNRDEELYQVWENKPEAITCTTGSYFLGSKISELPLSSYSYNEVDTDELKLFLGMTFPKMENMTCVELKSITFNTK